MAKKHYNQVIGFADRLNQAMYDRDVNAVQLGKMVGLDSYTWTRGYAMPNSLILAKLCGIFNLSADYLLFGK